ncbi:hypothetical protein ATANTOWER_008794, partial [Ataeniobius toweri]|nr:hypothetical protein [Ataeniobius toweri]
MHSVFTVWAAKLCLTDVMLMVFVVIGHWGALTLKRQHLTAVDHDAELQHELRSALYEGLEQTQHADICALKHHAAVVVTALWVSMPAALHPQIQGVDIP